MAFKTHLDETLIRPENVFLNMFNLLHLLFTISHWFSKPTPFEQYSPEVDFFVAYKHKI